MSVKESEFYGQREQHLHSLDKCPYHYQSKVRFEKNKS